LNQTNIYFIRHAQSDFSVKEDAIRPLTAKGKKDSLRVTEALKPFSISRIYSSPYRRAIETLADLEKNLNLEIIKKEGFRERKVGRWVDDFENFTRKQWQDFSYKIPEGECLEEVQKRNINSLHEVLSEASGENIVIGTHGTALCTIINFLDSSCGFEFFWKIVDKTPLIINIKFAGKEFINFEETPLP